MTSLGERLKAKTVLTKTVTVDGETCTVRGIGRIAKNELIERCSTKKDGLNTSLFEANILAACVIDPETDQAALPSPDDWDLPSNVSGPLVQACMEVCGFSSAEIDEAKNSSATES